MLTVQPATIQKVKRIFAAHVGQAEPIDGYGATPWRKWLIAGYQGHWYVVTKADPTGKPKAFLKCSLAQVKANLLAGY